ncbi:bifunctional adenosylcobinamide kinase/adenosylcobinamide-phosphate guanylyltransferase [Marinobacterium mangrovicola]|uniref:Bifunctional adenosylcobalamin biosynthesis protein n=1 Tax=Marinobacterium mangrovicola TaxID=1476959 RepID=A0A4R1GD05_9GAMM|nr:bifunctional adenosylcobinamide kinase/adenosylcobinamide-phosphate guanylyltransferase [Marinobacterium mangrovicola]TCK04713.1 adenosylcobinamide kinase /adenosylcobinamide-phosphate guanylyltransferase [Marinobacterium mangrovicola]
MIRLITGGARSGKSTLAERLAEESGLEVIYIATAQTGDGEMSERVALHRERRPDHWQTVEEPLRLVETIRRLQQPGRCLLVDCLTLWVTNLLLSEADIQEQRELLYTTLANAKGEVILVTNETGMGVVPMGELSRRFVDEAGWLNQAVAAVANQVVLTVAGLPLTVKGEKL